MLDVDGVKELCGTTGAQLVLFLLALEDSLPGPHTRPPRAVITSSPWGVNGISVLPVCEGSCQRSASERRRTERLACLPLRLHSVSPCRTMKSRGILKSAILKEREEEKELNEDAQ